MELWLVDIDASLIKAWKSEFAGFEDVFIIEGDILQFAENTIVSPSNSYGFMDGGIDRLYTEFFGLKPQEEIQKQIQHRTEGYLPVGTALLVKTGNKKIPFMIAAPTMLSPGPVNSVNSFFAMSALLQIAHKNRNIVKKVFCPGLGTGIGRVLPNTAAWEMANAYRKWKNKIGNQVKP
ncbi:MAG: AraC family transcriptional regulator [Desulfobacterales bacterium]|nr:AraC family transcriptional regulator [Desulfobacterales bacterium]